MEERYLRMDQILLKMHTERKLEAPGKMEARSEVWDVETEELGRFPRLSHELKNSERKIMTAFLNRRRAWKVLGPLCHSPASANAQPAQVSSI